MAKENEVGNDNEEVEELEDLPEIKEGEDDTTDYKALAKKNHGIAKRNATKLSKLNERIKELEKGSNKEELGSDGKPKAAKEEKKEVLDKLDRAVLRFEKIIEPDEIALVETYIKETGKDIEAVLASKHFQAELQEMRDLAATDNAIPGGTKRSGNSAIDTVEYWLKADKLPPVDQVELRRKVVNAKIGKEKSQSHFSDKPVV
jgi:hypothetical protein